MAACLQCGRTASRLRAFPSIVVVLAAVLASGPVSAGQMVLSGSTTVQSRILDPLAEDIRTATGIDLKVEGIGSGNGLKRLFAGEIPAAIVSAELKSLLAQAGAPDDGTYRQHVVLEDLIVPIVNARNPVKELSWEQLAAIFSGSTRNWRDVGGADRAIRIITSHPESATREVVWELVMGKKRDYHRSAHIVYATKKEMVLVAESEGAIGAVSQGFVDLYLADIARDGDPAEVKVIATKRISRPLALVTKGQPDPDVAKLLEFLRSDPARRKFK